MANYYAHARSNYFKVKDVEAFREALKDVDCSVEEGNPADEARAGLVCLISKEVDHGGWPTQRWSEEHDDYIDIDIVELVAPHLEPGWVCVLEEIGFEKMRFLSGYARAFNHKGEEVVLNLQDVYDRIKEKGLGEQWGPSDY